MGPRVAQTTCDLILSCPRYKHLAASKLAYDQRQPETNECDARDGEKEGESQEKCRMKKRMHYEEMI